MSHEATNWAIKQRGLTPAEWVVLWHLCDRYHPDHGCFPTQERLADDCQMSRSGLNNQLRSLEEKGMVQRVKRFEKGSNRQKSTLYILGFQDEFKQDVDEPCLDFGHGSSPKAVSKNQPKPCPKNGDSRVQNLDTNSVREPLREPVREKEKNPKKKNSNDGIRESLISIISPDMADEFIAHRQEMKKPLTPRATKMLVSKVKWHPDPDAVFRESIANGWQGVFPDAVRGSRNDPLAPTGRPETTEELERRLLYGV